MKTLLIVDVQNDFCPGGSLAVSQGDQIIPVVNQLQADFQTVIFTQDWHPRNHGSFAVNHPTKHVGDTIDLHGLPQILWPAHCVQGTPGAEFHPSLNVPANAPVFKKGSDPAIDSYSAFFDNAHRRSTGLSPYLRTLNVERITVVGLATDYCIKYSVLDALGEGFSVEVVRAGCRAVNLTHGDDERAWREMVAAGAVLI